MNKPVIYLWWIGLLMLWGPISLAQDNGFKTSHVSNTPITSCQTDCFNNWILQGNDHFNQKAFQQAIPFFEHALRIKRREEDPKIVIQCLIDLSLAVAYDHQFERARAHLEEASWHLRQQPDNLFHIKSDHLITQIRQTVDSLAGIQQAPKQAAISHPATIVPTRWRKFKSAIQIGTSTGIILFCFILGFAVFSLGKYRKDTTLELDHLKQTLQYVTQQHDHEKNEKNVLLLQNQRLAADIQDGLGNLISSVKLHVEQIDDGFETPSINRTITLRKVSFWLEQACEDLREISQKLLDRQPSESGLVNMLAQHKDYLISSGFDEVKIFHHGFEKELTLEQESAIYGIIMTWTRHLRLHSQANVIHIQLNLDAEGFNLIIEDDDTTSIFNTLKGSTEAFLRSDLKRRIAALGGKMLIDSSPGSRNALVVEIKDL